MSYQDFLNSLVLPIQYFVNWLSQIADSLIHNYIVITFLGIILFISLVWFVFYFIFDYIDKINNRYDDYNDKMYNYELLKEVQSDYLDKHYNDEFDYRYRSKILNGQVLNAYLSNNSDLDIDNKRLANFNKLESLKQIKNDILNDNDSSNDSDLDLIIPPKPQLASVKELNKNLIEEYPNLHNDLKNDINNNVDRISRDFVNYINSNYAPLNNVSMYNLHTGEVVSRFIDDKSDFINGVEHYRKYDLLTGKSIFESDYVDLVNHNLDLQDLDKLDKEGL